MEILINKRFTQPDAPITDLREVMIYQEFSDAEYYFDKRVSKVHLIKDYLEVPSWENELEGDSWVVNFVHDESDRVQFFLIIRDPTLGWYVTHLHNGKFRQKAYEHYKRAKGYDIITKETRVVENIILNLQFFFKTESVYDSRSKIVDSKQRIKYSGTKSKEECRYFYESILQREHPRKWKNLFFPDITIKRTIKGKETIEYVEIEKSQNDRVQFLKKLFKLQSTGRRIYFIFAEKHMNPHLALIKEFQQFRKFKSLFYCTLEDFKISGVNAFKRLKG